MFEYEKPPGTFPEKADTHQTDPKKSPGVLTLPDGLVQNLRQGIQRLDIDRIQDLIDEAEQTHPKIAGQLRDMALNYDFERMEKLLSPEEAY